MSPETPGQKRLGLRVSQIRQATPYRNIGSMPRTDIFLKVVVEHEDDERPEKLAEELRLRVERQYGVRYAEISSIVPQGSHNG